MLVLPRHQLPTPWHDPLFPAEKAAALIAQPGSFLFTDTATPTAGHLFARIFPAEPADILTLYVPPAHRRQGRARALLAACRTQAEAANCPAIVLEVRASNTPAITLYQSLGFTPLTTRPHYYQHPDEEALVLTLKLVPAAKNA